MNLINWQPIGGGIAVTRRFTKKFFDENIAPIRKELFREG
jgi:hypothetical protein